MPRSALQTLEHYLGAFSGLKVSRAHGRFSPYKPCMLPAVLGLAEAGSLVRNQIELEPPLLERYVRIFEVVQVQTDRPNP